MQAQTEPKLHPETANMEFEQVITKRSATLKGDLKVNLEPKWFLRRFPWKFHVSDFRAALLFTSYCAHILMTIQVPGLWWGKNWNQNTSRKRCDLFLDMCWVPCSSHNLPKSAATGRKPDSEERKTKRHERITNISKLRKRWKEQQGAKERQTWQFYGEFAGAGPHKS